MFVFDTDISQRVQHLGCTYTEVSGVFNYKIGDLRTWIVNNLQPEAKDRTPKTNGGVMTTIRKFIGQLKRK